MSSGGDVVCRHLAHLRWRNLRPATVIQRRNALRRLERAVATDPLACETDQILKWLSRDITPQTAAAEMSHLKGFYKWAVREGLRIDNPMDRIDRPRLPRNLPRPIPEADLGVAFEMAPDRVRPMLYLAAYAGLRACEIAALRAEEIHWDHDPPILIVREGKGGGDSVVPLAPVLEPILRALPTHGYLFPRRDGKPGQLPAWNVSHMANGFLHGIGIDHTLHSLRHRFGTQAYRASGRDLRQTQELLRHRSPVSTAMYTAIVPAEGAMTVSALPVH